MDLNCLKLMGCLKLVSGWIQGVMMKPTSAMIVVKPENLLDLIKFFKFCLNFNYSSLMDVWACDYPSSLFRFEMNYMLLNYTAPYRLVLSTYTTEYIALSTVEGVFSSANWLEREVWDMYGVFFYGHKDLRSILTDYGFSGYPLSKDFPLTGYSEVSYDDTKKQVVLEPLEVSQEFSLFNFKSPWENNYVESYME